MRDSAKKKERGRNEETKRGGEREKEREVVEELGGGETGKSVVETHMREE